MRNGIASLGRMPANVSLGDRAIVTAGLANDIDDVNQYAQTIYAATANGVAVGRARCGSLKGVDLTTKLGSRSISSDFEINFIETASQA